MRFVPVDLGVIERERERERNQQYRTHTPNNAVSKLQAFIQTRNSHIAGQLTSAPKWKHVKFF